MILCLCSVFRDSESGIVRYCIEIVDEKEMLGIVPKDNPEGEFHCPGESGTVVVRLLANGKASAEGMLIGVSY